MNLYSVIKNDGPGNVLIWKFTGEDFNNNSQLIVMENEEALFVKDGVIVQQFTGGRYTLNTKNFPFLGNLRNKLSGGKSPFSCKVYFVDKSHKLELFWGTDSPMQMIDAEFDYVIGVRSRGSYSIQIKDSKKFFIKFVGPNVDFVTQDMINERFRTAFLSKIKVKLAQVMKQYKRSVLNMATEMGVIEDQMFEPLQSVLDEYGIRLVNFYISDISVAEDDPNYIALCNAFAQRGSLKVQGENWGKLTAKELLKDVANNPGAGGVGTGVSIGMVAGNAFNALANVLFEPIKKETEQKNANQTSAISRYAPKKSTQPEGIKCPKCSEIVSASSNYCNHCGTPLKMVCSNCSKEITATSNYCPECGESLG